MEDMRTVIQNMFSEQNRYSNFGDALVNMHVQGFRCHTNTLIEIRSPITAFCGLNGTGKSTLLQLAAVAYKHTGPYRYYINNFIVSGILDPAPFTSNASVTFGYWQENRTTRRLALNRSTSEKRWSGYRRQPTRSVYFAGMGLYLPKIEVRDFVVRYSRDITVTETRSLPARSMQWTSRILRCSYDAMDANTVKHGGRSSSVVTVQRIGSAYSEANMGCGEGRIQHIVRELETLPEKSLVLLEEPETSLHPSAQAQFAVYLIDVCKSRGHQILITTHSEYLLAQLPAASRIYLDRSTGDIQPIPGITTAQAVSLMTEGEDKALVILVEDEVAVAVLTEILRRGDPNFLRTVKIHVTGDRQTIQSIMNALRKSQLPMAAVRDGDTGEAPKENLFKLPGTRPPEKELLEDNHIASYLSTRYDINLQNFRAWAASMNHHEWLKHLAEQASVPYTALLQELASEYAKHLTWSAIADLTDKLKAAIGR